MWGKSFAAIFLAPPLGVALVGLLALLSGNQQRDTLPILLMFFPAWVGAMALAYHFKTALRAWLWMGGATLAGFGLIHGLKAAGLLRVAA
ncbi:hypothetical protein F2P45_13020 [Massilia sp. CCM 8733]|uniref:Transmembrane protein n=1 Tax=Massilia mucilaginosa TaxID=2609282 RepID=A0ABX0NSZ5_9BURK|nr:hypothetical protein [Massilia mucilaginosa]NHZ89927.1 hypothetical protein [Massilia mucilaginosa]